MSELSSNPSPRASACDGVSEPVDEALDYALLNVESVGRDAGLAGITELGDPRRFDRDIEVGIIEHDHRRIAAEL